MRETSEKIGVLIKRLFQHGFMNDEYWYLLFSNKKADLFNEESNRSKLLLDISKNFYPNAVKNDYPYLRELDKSKIKSSSILKRYNNIVHNLLEDDPKYKDFEDAKYLVPPLSPFDMFAITSTLLLKSGAYHHFEAQLEDSSFSEVSRSRTPTKMSFIHCDEINSWRKISEKWHSYTASKNKDPFICCIKLPKPNNNHPNTEYIERFRSNILEYWSVIIKCWDDPVHTPVKDQDKAPEWWSAAYSLMAIADLASKDAGFKRDKTTKAYHPWLILAEFIIQAVSKDFDETQYSEMDYDENTVQALKEEEKRKNKFQRFKYVESISIADRSFVNIMPKSKTASLGCTLRCLSHNLAHLPSSGIIRAGWAWASETESSVKQNPVFNLLLIPYPYSIHSTNFKPTAISQTYPKDCNDSIEQRWGSFSLTVDDDRDADGKFITFVSRLLDEAKKRTGDVHGIVLPELALSRKSIISLRDRILEDHPSIELICSGTREHPYKDGKTTGKPIHVNGAYMASLDSNKSVKKIQHEFFHEKHHRWRITAPQIHDYDLAPALDPSRVWWEDTRVVNRRLPFLVMRNQWSVTSLICEDLARNDPAKPLVEAIGPNLVIALLMDGPQLTDRWSARYATVLADDPGSSVLAMSSFGLIGRSNQIYSHDSDTECRAFALWRDDTGTTTPIELEKDSHATLISLTAFPTCDYAMDGRSDNRSISLRLTGQRQIKDSKTLFYPTWDKFDNETKWEKKK